MSIIRRPPYLICDSCKQELPRGMGAYKNIRFSVRVSETSYDERHLCDVCFETCRPVLNAIGLSYVRHATSDPYIDVFRLESQP